MVNNKGPGGREKESRNGLVHAMQRTGELSCYRQARLFLDHGPTISPAIRQRHFFAYLVLNSAIGIVAFHLEVLSSRSAHIAQ